MPQLLAEAAQRVRSQCDLVPSSAIILGSGLGGLADKIEQPTSIPYDEIPGFARSTAGGHRGQLILGHLTDHVSGKRCPVVAMAGRFHRYEGWDGRQIAFPVQLMSQLGATRLVVSNAAGGVNPKFRVGDIVVLRDHIDRINVNLGLETSSATGVPIRSDRVYDDALSRLAIEVSLEGRFQAWEGTYLATTGPNYETRAEYRMMRRMGADLAGMSTVPEVLVAASLGMRILGLSMVSNVANPDRPIQANHEEVLEAGRLAEVKMEAIVRRAVAYA